MPKCFFFASKGSIFARWSTQTRINMGSSETEVKELAVMPWILLGSNSTVTTVTPVVKWPSALRNSNAVSCGVGILEVFEDTILGAGKAKRRIRVGNAAAADRMSGGIRNGVKSHGAKDRDSGRNGSRRLRACVSDGESWGTHPDRLARGGPRARDRKTFTRAHWRRRADRRPGQSFCRGCVRCRGVDRSLLRHSGGAEAIEERVEAGNDCDRYHGAFGGDDWRRTDARARRLARFCSRADEGTPARRCGPGGSAAESWGGTACRRWISRLRRSGMQRRRESEAGGVRIGWKDSGSASVEWRKAGERADCRIADRAVDRIEYALQSSRRGNSFHWASRQVTPLQSLIFRR